MKERQLHALLISGEERRFIEATLEFQKFLVKDVGLDTKDIRVIMCTYMGNDYIMEESQLFFERLPRDGTISDVVLLYNGHGGKGHFFPNDSSLTYEQWAKLIANNGDFIFINNSCYSGSAEEPLTRLGLLPEKGLLLASSNKNEVSYGYNFLELLIKCYRDNKAFRRKEIADEEITSIAIATFPKGKNRYTEGYLATIGYKESPFKRLKNPILIGGKQHPVISGKNLDYLLFKK